MFNEVLYLLVGCGLHPDCRFLVGLWVLLTALGLRMFNEVLYLLVGCGLHPDCRFLVGLWVLQLLG